MGNDVENTLVKEVSEIVASEINSINVLLGLDGVNIKLDCSLKKWYTVSGQERKRLRISKVDTINNYRMDIMRIFFNKNKKGKILITVSFNNNAYSDLLTIFEKDFDEERIIDFDSSIVILNVDLKEIKQLMKLNYKINIRNRDTGFYEPIR